MRLGVGRPLPTATPRTAVRAVVDDIAGVGCVDYLIRVYLCWGHCRVVLQLPTPPKDAADLAEISQKGGEAHGACDRWHQAMKLCMRWFDTDGKATVDPRGAHFNHNVDTLASRAAACPPLMLAQVRPPSPMRPIARMLQLAPRPPS